MGLSRMSKIRLKIEPWEDIDESLSNHLGGSLLSNDEYDNEYIRLEKMLDQYISQSGCMTLELDDKTGELRVLKHPELKKK